MKWTLIVLLVVAVLVAIALFVGSRLPLEHIAIVKARYAAKPEAVWALISNPASATGWRRDLKSVELLAPVEGKLAWREESKFGKINFLMTESSAPSRQVARITNDDLAYGGQWEFSLMPVSGGTELSVTERGFVKPALFRFMSRTIFGYTSTIVAYQKGVGAALGERVEPVVVATGF